MDRLQTFYTEQKLTALEKAHLQNRSNTQNGMRLLLDSLNKATWTTRAGEKIDQDRLWAAYDRALAEIDTHITCTGSRYESAVQILCEYYHIAYKQEVKIPGTDSTLDFLLKDKRLMLHIDGAHHKTKPGQRERDARTDKAVDKWIQQIYDAECRTTGIPSPIIVIRIDTDTIDKMGWEIMRAILEKTLDSVFADTTFYRL